jgi:hypothetical protein
MNEGGGAAEWVSFAAAEAIEKPLPGMRAAEDRPNAERAKANRLVDRFVGGTRTGTETCYPKRPEISRQ